MFKIQKNIDGTTLTLLTHLQLSWLDNNNKINKNIILQLCVTTSGDGGVAASFFFKINTSNSLKLKPVFFNSTIKIGYTYRVEVLHTILLI
jgi:hypothetical protein